MHGGNGGSAETGRAETAGHEATDKEDGWREVERMDSQKSAQKGADARPGEGGMRASARDASGHSCPSPHCPHQGAVESARRRIAVCIIDVALYSKSLTARGDILVRIGCMNVGSLHKHRKPALQALYMNTSSLGFYLAASPPIPQCRSLPHRWLPAQQVSSCHSREDRRGQEQSEQ